MIKALIVAIANNGAIGRDNQLLWHLSEDLKYFRRITTGHPIIMGRKTYESIGRPLPKRTNIVITRGSKAPEGTLLANSLQEAFDLAAKAVADTQKLQPAIKSDLTAEEGFLENEPICFVMGGGQIYEQAMQYVDKLYITHVHAAVEDADTFFPEISPQVWELESKASPIVDEKSSISFEFVVYKRRAR